MVWAFLISYIRLISWAYKSQCPLGLLKDLNFVLPDILNSGSWLLYSDRKSIPVSNQFDFAL